MEGAYLCLNAAKRAHLCRANHQHSLLSAEIVPLRMVSHVRHHWPVWVGEGDVYQWHKWAERDMAKERYRVWLQPIDIKDIAEVYKTSI